MAHGVAINHVLSILFNVTLLFTIGYASYRHAVEYKKLKDTKKPVLFAFGLLLNMVAFACIFVLFWKSVSQFTTGKVPNGWSNPLFFGCHMIFFMHLFLIMVLFVRIYYIFHTTDLRLSICTIVLFVITLALSSTIFVLVLTTQIHVPGITNSMVNCAITLCAFNVLFMICITSLFLNKLCIVFRRASQSPQRDNALINLIIKTALLSFISLSITFISCLLLLFVDNPIVSMLSDWVVSIDIYSNFLCYSLSFKHFNAYYLFLCRCCDRNCRRLWHNKMFVQDTRCLSSSLNVWTPKPKESVVSTPTTNSTTTSSILSIIMSSKTESVMEITEMTHDAVIQGNPSASK